MKNVFITMTIVMLNFATVGQDAVPPTSAEKPATTVTQPSPPTEEVPSPAPVPDSSAPAQPSPAPPAPEVQVTAPQPVTPPPPSEKPVTPETPVPPPAEPPAVSPSSSIAPPAQENRVEISGPLGILIRTEDILKVTDAVVVDVREPESFLQGHIPGAVNLPLRSLSETREEVQNLLRPIDQLLPLLAERGIMPEKQVVVYGENAKAADVSGAARMFWVLEYLSFPRVHVLDGGWKKWVGEGRAIDTGPGVATPVPVESVKIKLRPNVIARQEDVLELVRRKSGVLVDSRPASYYSGAEKAEYVLRPGHIPTAENRPAISMLQGDALTFKTPEEISGAMQVGEQTTGRKIITYCNEGNSASLAYLGYRLLGCENVSMYDGSMAEWSRNPALAVEAEIPTAQPPTALTSAPIPVSSATPETVPPTPDPVTTPTNPTPPTVQPVP